jgi:hypothetical protein
LEHVAAGERFECRLMNDQGFSCFCADKVGGIYGNILR